MYLSAPLAAHLPYEIVNYTSPFYDDHDNLPPVPFNLSVQAPAGMKVVSGGYELISGSTAPTYSQPSADGSAWELAFAPQFYGSVKVWVICIGTG